MTTTRTPTSGAADLPEALHRVIDDFERRERGIPQAHIAAALVTELRAALAAGQATAAQAGEYPALVCDYCGALTPDPWHSSGMLHGKMSKHIHSCDACASRGQAPALTNLNCKSEQKRLATLWGFVPAQADSVQEDAARYRWLREGNDAKHGAAWHVAVNLYGCEWDAAIDAARKQGVSQ